MKPESQRIAIAEACGMVRDWDYIRETYRQFQHRDDGGEAIFTLSKVPDYLNDLNAMHEAEQVLSEFQFCDYSFYVSKITNSNTGQVVALFEVIHATAAQRAQAFLKTLGLWKEEPVSEATVEGLR